MSTALWRDTRNRHQESIAKSATANAGLMVRRGLRAWPKSGDSDTVAGTAKADLIQRIAGMAVPDGYRWAYDRWAMATTGGAFASVNLDLIGRLYIGLTRDSALETGITVQHAWGMPMIPGSALKGISRRAAQTASTLKDRADVIEWMFGSEDDTRPECGGVVFHDAWWDPASNKKPFAAEIVTPHHAEYYNMGARHATDFDSPIPAPQIAAQGRFRFVVQVESERGNKENDRPWTKLVLTLLKVALQQHGVGGKTTSGYGLFESAGNAGAGQ